VTDIMYVCTGGEPYSN